MAYSLGLMFSVLTGFAICTVLAEGNTTNNASSSTQPPAVSNLNPATSKGSDQRGNSSHSFSCEYSITEENTASKVNITVNFKVLNVNNGPNETNIVILKDNSNNTIRNVTLNFNETSYLISNVMLKPCQHYTVSVHPACKLNGSNRIPKKHWETPSFNWTKNVNTLFTWTNRPGNCNETGFHCDGIPDFKENKSVELKPYNNYSCTPIHPFLDRVNFTVYFECELQNINPEFKVNETNITASWDLRSPNCNQREFVFNITCNSKQSKSWNCSWKYTGEYCMMSSIYDSNHTCTTDANYNNKKVKSKKDNVTIPAGRPEIQENSEIKINYNTAHVKYKVTWKGNTGMCHLALKIGDNVHKNLSEQAVLNECNFSVEGLYYLTSYTFEISAKNANGKESDVYRTNYTTPYNYHALLGFLGFLIVVTFLALLLVMYKIFALHRKQTREVCETDQLLPLECLLHVEPIGADALVETYRKKIADEGRLFMEEFQSIPRIFSNYTVKEAKKSENQPKNRYVDILPYDYNRVSLSNGGRHDYVNASFIEGYKESNKYIAAQGPKEDTVEDFWRMVWEQKSSIIVMVTRCEEVNKNKCAQYWPSMERETEIFDDFVVKIKHEEKCPDYIIRQLSLMNRKEKTPERDVTHIQFISWPDHGVPGEPGLLLKLRRRVNSFKNIFSGPIVVHCSAGVGRTGTYISIDAMIESLEAEGRVDIYGYVVKLRRQRCLMVQVESQYVLIHTALIEYNQFGETEISLTDIHSSVNTLKQREGDVPSLLELEYQKLPKFKNWKTSNMAGAEENKKKNRSSFLPYDFNRVLVKLEEDEGHNSDDDDDDYSSDEDDEMGTKYINASFVDGYWCPRSLIAAEGPLPNTVEDFLQMLCQRQAPAVVMLTDCTENGKEFCAPYWADEKRLFGEMEVEVKETERTPTYIRRRLQIQSTKAKGSLTTEQYHFLQWAGHKVPANPLDLINMIKSIRQDIGYGKSTENTSCPIVVHCNDGSSRSGIFCALWKLLDSADTEKLVDIFQVAKGLRKERPGMFTTLEQYQYLYEALQATFPVQNGEVKKTAASPDSVQVINEESGTTSADQEEAANSQAPEKQEGPGAAIASPSPEEGSSEPRSVPEKAPSESTTNGPTVTVEI